MSTIDIKTVKTLTELSRISCSEEEQEHLLKDLKKILDYIDTLNEIDTENVEPCNQVIAGAANVFREDQVGKTLSRDVFLDNAPAKVGGMVKVPPVIKS